MCILARYLWEFGKPCLCGQTMQFSRTKVKLRKGSLLNQQTDIRSKNNSTLTKNFCFSHPTRCQLLVIMPQEKNLSICDGDIWNSCMG